jgi:hypothetical protein
MLFSQRRSQSDATGAVFPPLPRRELGLQHLGPDGCLCLSYIRRPGYLLKSPRIQVEILFVEKRRGAGFHWKCVFQQVRLEIAEDGRRRIPRGQIFEEHSGILLESQFLGDTRHDLVGGDLELLDPEHLDHEDEIGAVRVLDVGDVVVRVIDHQFDGSGCSLGGAGIVEGEKLIEPEQVGGGFRRVFLHQVPETRVIHPGGENGQPSDQLDLDLPQIC